MELKPLVAALLLALSLNVAPVVVADDVPECRDVQDESVGILDGDAAIVVDGEDSGLWENTNYEPLDGIQTEPGVCWDRTGTVHYDADTRIAP